ncbi:hypothetical protein E2493_02410 [Sphingomonas parva]|uniref:DUF6894 domain-containing protein n=1 Tax=Sphingomonas parva TaxID=2555898 RepID=A0A4Y8ZVR5_9SPHN|nr:hypothetical protein [Sphingomonas parva]TFI60118.1 hypothetical protein E2493_02410 [Sphingomonas parva]
MPRYFFHLYNAIGITRDEEGQELPSVEAARASAVKVIRDILRDEIGSGALGIGGRVVIADEASAIVGTVPFGEAVRIDSTPH